MSASATSASAGLCRGWRPSLLIQEPRRPASPGRGGGPTQSVRPRVMEAKHVLGTAFLGLLFRH